jgi:glyceraldehyde-3-phosphate dehydrogenase (ferredoxin)
MNYSRDFRAPWELGQENARRMLKELALKNLGACRFHRARAEDLMPEAMVNIFGFGEEFNRSTSMTASRITSRNASVFWESERNMDIVNSFHVNKKTGGTRQQGPRPLDRFLQP